MRLILSTRHTTNSTYSTEDGQILYKVDKPHKAGSSVATIRKAVHTVYDIWHGDGGSAHPQAGARSPVSNNELEEINNSGTGQRLTTSDVFGNGGELARGGRGDPRASAAGALEGYLAFYAQVEFHKTGSTRFRYEGLDVSVKDYFRKEGWSWYGRDRVFRASNGKEYRWESRAGYLEMITNDRTKTRVARFLEWRPHLGPLKKGRPATLEIDPACVAIMDEVMMTFIYCEKLRKFRKRWQRNGGSFS